MQLHGGTGTEMRISFRNLFLKTYSDRFGEAVRLFDDGDLSGWKTSSDDKAWSVKATRDKEGRLMGFGSLHMRRDRESAAGGGERSWLGMSAALPQDRRVDVRSQGSVQRRGRLEPAGVTVGKGKSTVAYNGEPREDLPTFVQGGKLAVPGNVAAVYRNVVVIPIMLAK